MRQVRVVWLCAWGPVVVCSWAGASILPVIRAMTVRGRNRWPWASKRVRRPGDDGHRAAVEAAQAGLHDVGRVGGAAVDNAAAGGLVTEAGEIPGRDRAGAQREDADLAAASLGPQGLAERQGEGLAAVADGTAGGSHLPQIGGDGEPTRSVPSGQSRTTSMSAQSGNNATPHRRLPLSRTMPPTCRGEPGQVPGAAFAVGLESIVHGC